MDPVSALSLLVGMFNKIVEMRKLLSDNEASLASSIGKSIMFSVTLYLTSVLQFHPFFLCLVNFLSFTTNNSFRFSDGPTTCSRGNACWNASSL